VLLSDGALSLSPVHPTFGGEAATLEEVQATLAEAFLPTDAALMHLNLLFIDTGEARILVDVGYGPQSNAEAPMGKLVGNLAHAGYAPSDITHIIISHAHPDHLWGVSDTEGNVLFPNAEVIFVEAEWAHWRKSEDEIAAMAEDPEMSGFVNLFTRTNACMTAIEAHKRLVEPDATIVPGVRLVPAPGHTPGHTAVLVEQGDERLLHLGDTANHHVLYPKNPRWHFGFDNDPVAAGYTRLRLFQQIASERARVAAYHFPFPGIGHIGRDGEAFRWFPEVWEW